MDVKVLFKSGREITYHDMLTCDETVMYSGFICMTDDTDFTYYLNMNEIASFTIKEDT